MKKDKKNEKENKGDGGGEEAVKLIESKKGKSTKRGM
jgi:hypothetical protein